MQPSSLEKLERAELNPLIADDLGTWAELPPRSHRHRLSLYIGQPATDIDVQVHTNDSSVCKRIKLFVPKNMLANRDEIGQIPLEFEGCPMKSSTAGVCSYSCNSATFETTNTGNCAMLYLRMGLLETGVKVYEITIVPV